jgi:hypothetical protein
MWMLATQLNACSNVTNLPFGQFFRENIIKNIKISKGIVISISAKSAKIAKNYQKIDTCYFYFFKLKRSLVLSMYLCNGIMHLLF